MGAMGHRLNITNVDESSVFVLGVMARSRGWTLAECLFFLTSHLRWQHQDDFLAMEDDARRFAAQLDAGQRDTHLG